MKEKVKIYKKIERKQRVRERGEGEGGVDKREIERLKSKERCT